MDSSSAKPMIASLTLKVPYLKLNQLVERLKQKAKDLMKKIGYNNQMSTANVDDHCLHILVQDGIVYLSIAEKTYPQKLAFVYLQEIAEAFLEEIKNHFGTSGGVDYQSKIETIENSYHFLKFENINKLQQELLDVSKIMSENFDMILNRDKNLHNLSKLSSDLKDSSGKEGCKEVEIDNVVEAVCNNNSFSVSGGNISGSYRQPGENSEQRKIKLSIGKNAKLNLTNNMSRNLTDGKPNGLMSSNSYYQQPNDFMSGLSNLSAGKVGQIMNLANRGSGTQKMQYFVHEGSSQKKTRKLRKNFDLLAQAMKNSSTAKREKKINFQSSDNRSAYTQQIPNLNRRNFLGAMDQTGSPSQKLNQTGNGLTDQIAQIYQYGSNVQQPFKDRKQSAYEILGGQLPQYQNSQSQRSQSGANTNHNQSLYSQISIRDNQSTPYKNLSNNQSRNSSMIIYQNAPQSSTQLIIINNQKQYLKVNDKTMLKKQMKDGNITAQVNFNQTNPSMIQHIQNDLGNQSQQILNINTGLNKGMTSTSFILMSDGVGGVEKAKNQKKKKFDQPPQHDPLFLQQQQQVILESYNNYNMNAGKKLNSQTSSRSNSQRRVQNLIGQPLSKQALIRKGANQLQNNVLLGQNTLTGKQSDYQLGKMPLGVKPSSSHSRLNSSQRQQITRGQEQKLNEIVEAYNTQHFFSGQASGLGSAGHQQNQTSQQNFFSGPKNGSQSSSATRSQQSNKKSFGITQSQSQSFDLQNYTSSSQEQLGSVSKSSKQLAGDYKEGFKSQGKNRAQAFSEKMSTQFSNRGKSVSQELLHKGKVKLQEKEYQSAINLFTESLKLDHSNIDAKFYKAVSYLDSGLIQESVREFNDILNLSPIHSELTHILLSIAYKRAGDMISALKILDQCIIKHPSYPDAYLARGQAYLISEKFDAAIKDFQQYSKLVPDQGMGYIGAGDSYKALSKWTEAIVEYTKALTYFQPTDQRVVQIYLKRGLGYYYLKQNNKALGDLQVVISKDHSNYKAHFYIGKILSRQYTSTPRLNQTAVQKIQNDAILHFEQVVKSQGNEVYSGNALFEIAKLRLLDKDFYEAYFNLKRAIDSNFNSKRLQLYKDFTEGVLYLIKRKIKKGVQILSDLLEILINRKDKKDVKQIEYLKHQAFIYRAYGYVAIEKYEVALQDLKKAKKIAKLDLPSIYNKFLGKGILRMDHEDYLMATKYFTKAATKFPSNKDPYCLHIISVVRSYTYSMADYTIDEPSKWEKIMQAKTFMDQAIFNCQKLKVPSLHFFRGLLYFQMHMFYEALKDFNTAIEEEEEPTASYYLARGRCYACLSILTEAMKDLSIALNLDESLQEAYIFRGKCAYLLGDNNLAFLDFQRLILTDPKNPMVHIYAGNLLMTTGAYQDAIKAFLNADTVQKTPIAAFQRARCYCALTDLENAKIQFKMAMDMQKNEFLIKMDSQCLTALMKVCSSNGNEKTIQSAIDIIDKLIQTYQGDEVNKLKKKESRLNIQIIPNVKRIKLEKVLVAREMIDQKDLPSISVDLNQTVDTEMVHSIQPYSYYYENVFQAEDLALFKAVFSFYKKDYKTAVQGYEHLQQLKLESNKIKKGQQLADGTVSPHQNPTYREDPMHIYDHSQRTTPAISMNSSKTDLSDVGLCSLNVHETNFNILLCYLLAVQPDKALERLNELIAYAPKKYSSHFFLIRGLVFEQIGQKDKAEKDFTKYQKYDPKNYDTYFKEGKEMQFEPFPIKQRLCAKFDLVKIQLGTKRPLILTKPSFSMPFIKPPNMIPNIDEEIIQSEFSLKQIDAPMPEAPWVRRMENGAGIRFTDDILPDEDDEEQQSILQQQMQNIHDMQISQEAASNLSKPTNLVPQKPSKQQQYADESPYVQSIEVPANKPKPNGKGISERILKNAMVYLVENDEDEFSDKHKISLFDDSKFEEGPQQNMTITEKHNHNRNEDSLDQSDILMVMSSKKKQLNAPSGSSSEVEDDDDDSSEEEEEKELASSQPLIVFDRDSMVLVGENVIKVGKKKRTLQQQQNRNAMLIASEDEEKQKMLSDLNSNIDMEQDISPRESIFKSRQSSKR